MKLVPSLFATSAVAAVLCTGCSDSAKDQKAEAVAGSKSEAQAAEAEKPVSKLADAIGGELHIYTWSDYIAPELIEKFETLQDCKVVIDTFDSNEAMYAKIKAGGAGYDILMPSSYLVATMAREGLIVKLDHAKMPNVKKNFDSSFATQIIDPTFEYNVPYAVTYTGFCYDRTKIPEDVDVRTWKVLENPAFRGKVTLLDDMREVIGAGLMSLGYPLNSKNPAEIEAAVAQVLKWKANVRKFDAESYKTEVPAGATWIGHGYSTDTTQVINGDEEAGVAPCERIGFALPMEGYSIAFDEMVISAKAPNPALAYAFIDFLYEGTNAAANMDYIQGPNPVKPAIEALDEELRDQIILDEETIKAGQVILPIDDDPVAMELYTKAWDKIKATSAN